jgi:hypothetical protein
VKLCVFEMSEMASRRASRVENGGGKMETYHGRQTNSDVISTYCGNILHIVQHCRIYAETAEDHRPKVERDVLHAAVTVIDHCQRHSNRKSFILHKYEMSDFAALKRNRTAKETRSFVATPKSQNGPSSVNTTQPSTSTSEHAVTGDSESQMDVDEAPVPNTTPVSINRNGLYGSIPLSLDVRESKESGRGLYSTYARRPGELNVLSLFLQFLHRAQGQAMSYYL